MACGELSLQYESFNRAAAEATDDLIPVLATGPSAEKMSAGANNLQIIKPWLAVTAIVLVAIDLRPGIVSVGPILPSIITEFGLSHAMASLLVTIPDVLMGALALPTPWLARRFGRDRLLIAALLLLLASTALRAFSTNVAGLLLSTAGVGAGIAISGALIAGFVKGSFPNKAAVFMGIYATALSFGSTLSAAATGPVAAGFSGGWRLAAGMWSVLGIFAVGAWACVALSERRRSRVSAATARVALPLRSRTAWLIAIYFAFVNFLFYAILSWTAPMYREHGLTPGRAGLILASFTAFFMFANPIFGWLSKSQDRRVWLALCGALTALGLLGVAIAPTAAPFIFIPLAAFGLGGGFTLSMTLPLDNTHSVEESNVWTAFVLTVGYLIAACGPLIVGFLRDITGSFHLSIWLLLLLSIVMIAVSPFLKPADNF